MPEKKFLVSGYMQPKAVTLAPEATFREAAELMVRTKTNGLVVVDAENKVVGILSSWDLIQYVVPDYLEEDKHLAAFESGDLFASRIQELQNDPISKFMSTSVHTCNSDASLMEAATLLSEFHIRQLPVVDEAGVLVGYINRTDIKKAMGDVLGIN